MPAEAQRQADVFHDSAAVAVPAVVPAPRAGAAVVLSPGGPARAQSRVPRHHGRHIVLTEEEVLLVNGRRCYRCARPGMAKPGGPPEVNRLLAVFVHRRAVGPLSEGHRFVYALGASDRLLGTVDDSDTWAFRQDHLEAICESAGIGYGTAVYEDVRQLVEARPE